MSLITQCPACATMFRVVPDQLRISEGWVRCGQCDEVFDANAHLQNFAEPSTVAQPTPTPPAQPVPEPISVQRHVPENPVDAYDWGPVLGEAQPPAAPAEVGNAAPEVLTQTGAQETRDPYFEEQPLVQPVDQAQTPSELDAFLAQSPHGPADDQPAVLADAGLQPAVEPALRNSTPAEDEAAEANAAPVQPELATKAGDEAPLSFMRQKPSTALPARPLVRNVLVALCLLLAGLLTLQYLVAERDRLAATAPSLRPALTVACEWLGCTISAPQQIESIAIESSTFTSLRPGVYVLNLSVKNTAAMELASPALELTLTGLQDQALLRRVLLPADAFGKLQIGAGAEVSASLPLQVAAGAAGDKVTGYKLVAFYP